MFVSTMVRSLHLRATRPPPPKSTAKAVGMTNVGGREC